MTPPRAKPRARTPQLEWTRRAVLAAGAALPVFLILAAVLGAGVSNGVGCRLCHAMEPYALAAMGSDHAGVGCEECHSQEGFDALMADGFRAMGWIANSYADTEAGSYTANPSECLGCHDRILAETVVSRGIRVRHADFISTPCDHCHEGTGHEVEDRKYRGPAMDDCLNCHKTTQQNITGCETCHPKVAPRDRRETQNAWRVTHGATWQQTHAMGNMATCQSCHTNEDCAKCHGVPMPHPAAWPREHGRGLDPVVRDSCATCHEPSWCDTCHGGLAMPHPDAFLSTHDDIAGDIGEEACVSCHDAGACDACHLQSTHPAFPGAESPHGG